MQLSPQNQKWLAIDDELSRGAMAAKMWKRGILSGSLGHEKWRECETRA
jgi:hypothetical protein